MTVAIGFELGRRDVTALAGEADRVVPVDPFDDRDLGGVSRVRHGPWSLMSSALNVPLSDSIIALSYDRHGIRPTPTR
jgi:hypothetical protein